MKRNNDRAVIRVVVFTGISALVTQLLIVRECIAQFQGNEFVIALTLFNWLILGGVGNRLARWIDQRWLPATASRLALVSLFLAALPVFEIYAIRCLRDVVFIHGSSVGFYSILLFILLACLPYGLMIGFALPYSLFTLKHRASGYPGTLIYMMDNAGNVAGGILFSFVLIYLVSPFQAILVVNLPLLATGWLLFPPPDRRRPVFYLVLCMPFIILVSGILFETASLTPAEGELAYYKDSRYGRITVHKNQELYTLFEDGSPVFSTQNIAVAEETVHYPLSQIEYPRCMLFISAQGQMMTEVEKHGLKTVDYVELNPEITSVLFKFGLIRDIPGVINVIHQDGRSYLANTDKIYDAIIVNLPEPTTFQINRFFTDRFFSLVKRHLRENGILSFSTQGFDNYLSEPQRQKLSSLFNTVSGYFKHVLMLPGQKIFFLCKDQPISMNIPELLSQKGIHTRYISNYYYGNLTQDRISQLNEQMDLSTPKNADMSPHLIKIMFFQWFEKHSTSPKGFIIGVIILCGIYLIKIRREEFVLFSTGCTTMGSEILVIFAVQIFFGYIYSQIGLIVTIFLGGLFPGAWLGSRWQGNKKQLLGWIDGMLIGLMLTFILAVQFGGVRLPLVFFLVFGLFSSLGCGCQFPLALSLMGDNHSAAARSFSADLIGAAFGTLLTSAILIPIFGIIWAAWGLIGLKCLSILITQTGHEKYQQT